jgi:hypothetical protein
VTVAVDVLRTEGPWALAFILRREICWRTGENDTWFMRCPQNNAEWMKQMIEQTRVDKNKGLD